MYAREWRGSGQPWHCPICTKTCCCTLRECPITHRHCKAYRYRRKRAQLAQPTLPTSLLMPNVQHCDPTAPPPSINLHDPKCLPAVPLLQVTKHTTPPHQNLSAAQHGAMHPGAMYALQGLGIHSSAVYLPQHVMAPISAAHLPFF